MIYTKYDFQELDKVGTLAATILDKLTPYVAPGVSTLDLDKLVAEFTRSAGAICAPMGYLGYPKNSCISINDVICHGIPSKNEYLNNGDIVNIDVTPILNGYYGDTSRMFEVGEVSPKAHKLISTTYDAMMRAISICRPKTTLGQIGKIIQDMCEAEGYSVVRDFCGHGTGRVFHENPQVLHYYDKKYDRIELREGEVFTIEPMINTGKYEGVIDANDWTARTIDGGLSAQFEHTIGITDNKVIIFTKSPAGYTKPPYKGTIK